MISPGNLQLGGYDLTGGSIRLLVQSALCMDPVSAPRDDYTGMTNPSTAVSASGVGSASLIDFNLGTTAAGDSAASEICWGDAAAAGFTVYAGTLTMNGPMVQDNDCYLGLECILQLSGTPTTPDTLKSLTGKLRKSLEALRA